MHTRLILPVLLSILSLSSLSGQNIFDSEDVLKIRLKGPVSVLLKDRGDDPQYHELSLQYGGDSTNEVMLPVRVRVRGNFRRLKSNCHYPPLMLNFSKENVRGTLFEGQNKMKLVMPCQGDKYIVREYLVYALYQLMTPRSFKARLVQIQLEDEGAKGKGYSLFHGILLEEEDQMAARNAMVSVDRMLVRPEQTQAEDFLTMAVFQYMIGNTDWSVQYRQNVKLIAPDSLSRPYTVPYDFDHSGIVWAPYAKPAPELQMSSVRERRYRGYCISEMQHFETAVKRFTDVKSAVYALYTDNAHLDDRYKKSTVKFLDDFYNTINDARKRAQEFQYPCREGGTGNVVIKGLKQN
jgi:hypothetical protein